MVSLARRVSALDSEEALETSIAGVFPNVDGTVGFSLGDVTTWSSDTDFITYARGIDGIIDNSTRVAWRGEKQSGTYVVGTRTGGSSTYIPDVTNFATCVPTHRWANDIAAAINGAITADGSPGIKQQSGSDIVFSTATTQPAPIAGKTIIWFKKIGA